MAANSLGDAQKKLTAWFDDLPVRDRQFLVAGGIIIGLIFLYLLVWKASYEFASKAEKHFVDSEELLNYVRQNEARLRELSAAGAGNNAGQALDSQGFMSVVTTSAQRNKVALNRIEPAGERRLRVAIDKAPFNDVIRWLEQLSETNNILIDQISVDRTDQQGVVNVRVNLQL